MCRCTWTPPQADSWHRSHNPTWFGTSLCPACIRSTPRGHKYGLVYPGVGWAIWRDAAALPRELVFEVNYLGGKMPTFALNFSRPGSEVLAQYFMFLALGREGYDDVQRASNRVARHIAAGIASIGPYKLITDGSELPVLAFTLGEDVTNYTVFDVSASLRELGWLVPAYTFPENRQDLSVLRVVVRAGDDLRHGRPVPGRPGQADGVAGVARRAPAEARGGARRELQSLEDRALSANALSHNSPSPRGARSCLRA